MSPIARSQDLTVEESVATGRPPFPISLQFLRVGGGLSPALTPDSPSPVGHLTRVSSGTPFAQDAQWYNDTGNGTDGKAIGTILCDESVKGRPAQSTEESVRCEYV